MVKENADARPIVRGCRSTVKGVSRRLLAAVLALTIGGMVMSGAVTAPASAAPSAGSADSAFLSLLNGLRGPLGLGSLSLDPQMSDIARGWSTQMASRGALSHNPSLGSQLQGVSKWGENVAFGGVPQSIFDGLVASTVHLRNMTDPQFNRIGIGTVTDAKGQLWTTHVFARSGSGAPAATPGSTATAGSPSTPSNPATTPTSASTPKTAPATSAPTTVAAASKAATTTISPAVPGSSAASPRPTDPADPAGEVAAGGQPVSSTSGGGARAGLLAAAAIFGLLLLGGVGFFLRRAMTSS